MSKEAIKFIETDNWKYLNQIFETRNGRSVKVISIVDKNDVLVEYQDKSKQRHRVRVTNLLLGLVPRNWDDSPVKFDTPRDFYMNSVWYTKEGYLVKIVEYTNEFNLTVEFVHDGTRIPSTLVGIRRGSIAYPYRPNRFGGVVGIGPFKSLANKEKYYDTWYSMLERGTEVGRNSIIEKEYKDLKTITAYENVSVSEEWMNYQNFAQWYHNYINSLNPDLYNEYQLDKDILQWNQKYKVYSKDTCCLVPRSINNALVGSSKIKSGEGLPIGVVRDKNKRIPPLYRGSITIVEDGMSKRISLRASEDPLEVFNSYKMIKEKHIREIAEQYYSINAITKEVYEALMKLEIVPYIE